jgi:hypothetical protein
MSSAARPPGTTGISTTAISGFTHIVPPTEIDYPRVWVTAFPPYSFPTRDEMRLSSLVVVWFQRDRWPVPDEAWLRRSHCVPRAECTMMIGLSSQDLGERTTATIGRRNAAPGQK